MDAYSEILSIYCYAFLLHCYLNIAYNFMVLLPEYCLLGLYCCGCSLLLLHSVTLMLVTEVLQRSLGK